MKHHEGWKSSSSIQWRLTQYCQEISVDVGTLQLVPKHPIIQSTVIQINAITQDEFLTWLLG